MRKENIKPMLAATAFAPFTKPGWLYEPKFDGIRALTSITNGAVKMESRNGLILNHRFPKLVSDLSQNANMVIDGEIVALDKHGKPSFQLLQQNNSGTQLVYYVFDMLFDNGKSIMHKPLLERKALLASKLKATKLVKLVKELPTTGEEAFHSCIKHGMEGIIAKQKDSQYILGRRCTSWVKIKGNQTAEFVIGGYTEGAGSRFSTVISQAKRRQISQRWWHNKGSVKFAAEKSLAC